VGPRVGTVAVTNRKITAPVGNQILVVQSVVTDIDLMLQS